MKLSYQAYEIAHLALGPARAVAEASRLTFKSPANPWSYTPVGKNIAAAAEVFERITRRYGKPIFGINATIVDGQRVPITEDVVWERPFCRLLRFVRGRSVPGPAPAKMLVVAPMSGHHATLLRGTIEALLPSFDVYVTDWIDARMVPLAMGTFDLDDYVDYLVAIFALLRTSSAAPVHAMGVCQPAVPLIAAVAFMEGTGDSNHPDSMTLMGGPIDTRRSPTAVNMLAQTRGTDWFRDNCLETVPFPYPGLGRRVYPGFLQLSGFMAMNMDRHVNAHLDMFQHLVKGDGDSAEKHRDFYDEYLAVMDLTAEFYMQTIEEVFVRHALPNGTLTHRGERIDLGAIRRTGLMTIEGERDDISGVGQTQAAHDLCVNLPDSLKAHYVQLGVGHYGVFNGSRYRSEIAPRIVAFTKHVQGEANLSVAAE